MVAWRRVCHTDVLVVQSDASFHFNCERKTEMWHSYDSLTWSPEQVLDECLCKAHRPGSKTRLIRGVGVNVSVCRFHSS